MCLPTNKWTNVKSNLKTCASNRFFFDWCLLILTFFFRLFKVRVSLWQDAPAEARLEQHLRDVEELKFDFVLLDHLMCWFDVGLGQKNRYQKIVTNSQFLYLCAVLILRDVPSMVLACDLCSHDYLSQGGNLCTNWDIKREGASTKTIS